MLYLVSMIDYVRTRAGIAISDEEGQGMIEYALIAALISIFAIAVIVLIGPQIQAAFQDVTDAFPV
jgi:pilus assembly protein Flp/PilA